jgi:PAS domain S-box-containing protein
MDSIHPTVDWQQLFGSRLRFLRTLENLTQGELAGRLGITVEHLSNMERGTSAPSFSMIIRLAETLGTEPANLFLFARRGAGKESGEPGDVPEDFEWTRYISAVGSVEHTVKSGRTTWSDSLFTMLGLEPGEVEAGPETFLRFVHPDDRPRAIQAVSEVLAGRDLPMQCCRMLRKDGRERFVLTHRALERDAGGRPLRMLGVVVDVTEQRLLQDSLRTMHSNLEERVRERTRGLAETVNRLEGEVGRRTRAEAAARESENRLRILGDNLSGGAVFQLTSDDEGRCRLAFASAGLAGLIGVDPRDGRLDLAQVLLAMHPEDRETFQADMEKCRAGKESLRSEVRFPRRDGTVAWVRFQAAYRGGEDGAPVCDGLALDITDLKRAEEERQLAVQRLQRAHALARIGHWEYRVGDGSVWWSDEIYETLGYEPRSRQATAEFFFSHLHPEDREAVIRDFTAAVAELREYRMAYRIIRRDGSPAYGYSIGRPMPGSRPGDLVYHGTLLDVTEHKAASEAVRAEDERLKGLMAAAGMGAWVWEDWVVRHDPAACRILGLDPAEGDLPMAQARAMILPEDEDKVPDPTQPGPGEESFCAEVRMRPPGGEARRVLLAGRLYRNPKGRPTRAEGLLLGLDSPSKA